ncbi:hypothetical protein QJS10_CPB22g01005 [Acorus calamus]|uniref:CCDC93 coiled-coil domain-containing protein n=1 Tax=Acorus calamus TaxID=4465 RepID=A0AAV9C2K4_ACOCL|nr:hypothetical protein QJS10_CPB22g01005 [Acorus calamus]
MESEDKRFEHRFSELYAQIQFQDALASTTACSRLINSMEDIVKGIKQKLGKVELELLTEQKVRDSLKEKYAMAISERRHFASLLKAFQL